MTGYVLRRLLSTAPTVFGVLLLSFLLFSVLGGEVPGRIAGRGASRQTIDQLRREYGLDKPLFLAWDSRFVSYCRGALTLDFGRALDGEQVIDKIKAGLGPSLMLTVPILFGGVLIAVGLSLALASVRGSPWDAAATLACTAAISLPYLGFIFLGQYFLAYRWRLFPVYFAPDLPMLENVALPVLTGIVAALGGHVRFCSAVLGDELGKDYIRTALAKGLSPARVLLVHVLKNAAGPVITRISLYVPHLFLGSLLFERFFGIPGLGYLTVEAVNARDLQVIGAVTYIGALTFVAVNLATDICYSVFDPRVRLD